MFAHESHHLSITMRLQQLVLATRNPNKLAELQAYLAPYDITVIPPDAGWPEVEETGTTFEENALLKADAIAQIAGLPALADDSGLCVEALGGRPGLYSARWAGPGGDYGRAFAQIEEELQQQGPEADRRAYFVCVLALSFPDGRTPQMFEGRVVGTIVTPPRGPMTFGYDPIFVPDGYAQTFAEMAPAEKKQLSHRARAIEQFVAAVSND